MINAEYLAIPSEHLRWLSETQCDRTPFGTAMFDSNFYILIWGGRESGWMWWKDFIAMYPDFHYEEYWNVISGDSPVDCSGGSLYRRCQAEAYSVLAQRTLDCG